MSCVCVCVHVSEMYEKATSILREFFDVEEDVIPSLREFFEVYAEAEEDTNDNDAELPE
jgi:hypothetical protein